MNDKINILLVEDEPSLALIIKESLETRHFCVTLCSDGEMAMKHYEKSKPDIIISDVMMPKMDGFSLIKFIRLSDKKTPIIFLTSKSQTSDVVEGFTIGCNDYLKKPFSMEELIVRINALVHKEKIIEVDCKIGIFTFNKVRQTLLLRDQIQMLTHRESELLELLYFHKNDVVERTSILKKLWQNDDFFSGRSMDVFITKLRKKLSYDKNVHIINIRGYGYKLLC